jgi:site-specific recombinase XerD
VVVTWLYGAGLRLLEGVRLRVKDVDVTSNQILVRGGKGDRDRVTMLPAALSTTMIYTHVLNRGPAGVRSPIDRVLDL